MSTWRAGLPIAAVAASLFGAGTGCGGGSQDRAVSQISIPERTVPTGQEDATPPASAAQSAPAPEPSSTAAQPTSPPSSKAAAYKRAYARLPFHTPPLNVRQIVVIGRAGPLLDARVGERSFLCEKTPAERRVAVASYYAFVLDRVRAEGQQRLRLRVSRLEPTAFIKHVYAIAENGRVELTAEGRSGGCPRQAAKD
jgi:hypothetical protein